MSETVETGGARALGRQAYEMFGDALGWVDDAGTQMPPWEGLSEKTRQGWAKAADTMHENGFSAALRHPESPLSLIGSGTYAISTECNGGGGGNTPDAVVGAGYGHIGPQTVTYPQGRSVDPRRRG